MPRHADQARLGLARSVEATAPGGLISVVAENPAAAPLRLALEGRWHDAVSLLRTTRRAGERTLAGVGDLCRRLSALAAPVQDWYGVGIATDHLHYSRADRPSHRLAFCLEWELGRRDPYRACGRLLHLIGRRDPLNGTGGGPRHLQASGWYS